MKATSGLHDQTPGPQDQTETTPWTQWDQTQGPRAPGMPEHGREEGCGSASSWSATTTACCSGASGATIWAARWSRSGPGRKGW
eukprot:4574667-Pyramimonas_sp.AAC.2